MGGAATARQRSKAVKAEVKKASAKEAPADASPSAQKPAEGSGNWLPFMCILAITAGGVFRSVFAPPEAESQTDHRGAPEALLARLNESLRRELWCADICSAGPSAKDISTADGMARRGYDASKANPDRTCTFRCETGRKPVAELPQGIPPLPEYTSPPEQWAQYVSQAAECTAHALGPAVDVLQGNGSSEAEDRLRSCGVVHLEGSIPEAAITAAAKAWEGFRAAGTWAGVPFAHVSEHLLRGGRQEVWMPFAPPFNATELIASSEILKIVAAYFDGASPLIDHVTVMNSEVGGSRTNQRLHSDVGEPRFALNVHVALADLPAELGPTRFCPATHTFAEKYERGPDAAKNSEDQVPRVTQTRYLVHGACADWEPELTYARALRRGEVTIYDGNVLHRGEPNRGEVDRPIFEMSFVASEDASRRWNYTKHLFERPDGGGHRQDVILREIHKFRDNWR